jgi:hypothetical protein
VAFDRGFADDPRYIGAKSKLFDLLRGSVGLLPVVETQLHQFVQELRHEQEGCIFHTVQERRKLNHRIANFRVFESKAWQELASRGWDGLTHAELLSVAQVLVNKLSIPVDREAKRRKCILVKWFDEHLEDIRPLLDFIHLEFETDFKSDQVRERETVDSCMAEENENGTICDSCETAPGGHCLVTTGPDEQFCGDWEE